MQPYQLSAASASVSLSHFGGAHRSTEVLLAAGLIDESAYLCTVGEFARIGKRKVNFSTMKNINEYRSPLKARPREHNLHQTQAWSRGLSSCSNTIFEAGSPVELDAEILADEMCLCTLLYRVLEQLLDNLHVQQQPCKGGYKIPRRCNYGWQHWSNCLAKSKSL